MPSTVMFRAPFGSPLTEDVRGRPGVAVPGIVNTRSKASREAVGKSVIWRPVNVVPTVEFCVCSNSPPPTTVTVSFAEPISSSTLIVETLATSILISVTAANLNPAAAIVAVYTPVDRVVMLYAPLLLVCVENSWLVAEFFTVTVAPATTEPLGSVTVPDSEPVEAPCPNAGSAQRPTVRSTSRYFCKPFLITSSSKMVLANAQQTKALLSNLALHKEAKPKM